MYMKPIVESGIVKIRNKFIVNKSASHDNIDGNFIIRKVQNAIVKPQAYSTYFCQQVLFQKK